MGFINYLKVNYRLNNRFLIGRDYLINFLFDKYLSFMLSVGNMIWNKILNYFCYYSDYIFTCLYGYYIFFIRYSSFLIFGYVVRVIWWLDLFYKIKLYKF